MIISVNYKIGLNLSFKRNVKNNKKIKICLSASFIQSFKVESALKIKDKQILQNRADR